MRAQRAPPVEPAQGSSFRDIFERELDFVWNCLRRLGVAERDLEDEALALFLRVKDALPEFDRERPLRPWLFGFAYRIASEYRRRPHRRYERLATDIAATADLAEPSPSPEQHAAAREEQELAMTALLSIELDRRAVLVLHDVYGQTMPDIADALKISLNTAYSRLRLARSDWGRALRRIGWRREQ